MIDEKSERLSRLGLLDEEERMTSTHGVSIETSAGASRKSVSRARRIGLFL